MNSFASALREITGIVKPYHPKNKGGKAKTNHLKLKNGYGCIVPDPDQGMGDEVLPYTPRDLKHSGLEMLAEGQHMIAGVEPTNGTGMGRYRILNLRPYERVTITATVSGYFSEKGFGFATPDEEFAAKHKIPGDVLFRIEQLQAAGLDAIYPQQTVRLVIEPTPEDHLRRYHTVSLALTGNVVPPPPLGVEITGTVIKFDKTRNLGFVRPDPGQGIEPDALFGERELAAYGIIYIREGCRVTATVGPNPRRRNAYHVVQFEKIGPPDLDCFSDNDKFSEIGLEAKIQWFDWKARCGRAVLSDSQGTEILLQKFHLRNAGYSKYDAVAGVSVFVIAARDTMRGLVASKLAPKNEAIRRLGQTVRDDTPDTVGRLDVA